VAVHNHDALTIAFVSRWHYEEPAFHRLAIRHIDTGLTFALSLRASPPAAESEADRDIATVQWAARSVAYHACMLLASRPEHRGAVFFRYRPGAAPDEPFFRPITEDAPPLPPVDSVLQPAGISETAPSPFFSRIMRYRHVVRPAHAAADMAIARRYEQHRSFAAAAAPFRFFDVGGYGRSGAARRRALVNGAAQARLRPSGFDTGRAQSIAVH
jgi:hypothetical protein